MKHSRIALAGLPLFLAACTKTAPNLDAYKTASPTQRDAMAEAICASGDLRALYVGFTRPQIEDKFGKADRVDANRGGSYLGYGKNEYLSFTIAGSSGKVDHVQCKTK